MTITKGNWVKNVSGKKYHLTASNWSKTGLALCRINVARPDVVVQRQPATGYCKSCHERAKHE